jgi:hypothetical protein
MQQQRIDVHRHESVLLEVDEEARCSSKLLEQQPKTTSRGGVRVENDECVARVLENVARGSVDDGALERVVALHKLLLNIGDQEEQVRRQRISLPESTHDIHGIVVVN